MTTVINSKGPIRKGRAAPKKRKGHFVVTSRNLRVSRCLVAATALIFFTESAHMEERIAKGVNLSCVLIGGFGA